MKLRPWELALAAGAVLFALAFSVSDWSWFHPGYSGYDEENNVIRVQLWREGFALPLVAFRGCLGHFAYATSSALLGPSLSSLHFPVIASFVIECLLLAALAERYFSQRAGVWALLVNCVCAFTLMRARSLLTYAFVPMEWLAMLWLLPYATRKWSALAWGLGSAALLLDYEAWTFGCLGLALAFWLQHRGKGTTLWAFLGMALGGLTVLALSWDMLQGHFALRLAMNKPHGAGDFIASAFRSLKAYWGGWDYLYVIAPSGQPVFPLWALPLLLLGLFSAWSRWKSGLAWILLGFLPLLLARDSADEPQRAMLAWAPLCLFAGAGAAQIWDWRPRLASWLLPLLCLAGAFQEVHAYWRSMQSHYAETYGESANLLAAAKVLKLTETGPRRLVTELNHKPGAEIRFLFSSLKQDPSSTEAVALVPWEYLPAVKPDWGKTLRVASPASQTFSPPCLLFLRPQAAQRLEAVESELKPLWSEAYRGGTLHIRDAALAYLDQHPKADPWVRTACWEAFLDSAMTFRDVPRERVRQAMLEPLCSATFYEWMTRVSLYEDKDPSLALGYAKAALKLDPSRENSKELFQQAQQRMKGRP